MEEILSSYYPRFLDTLKPFISRFDFLQTSLSIRPQADPASNCPRFYWFFLIAIHEDRDKPNAWTLLPAGAAGKEVLAFALAHLK